MGYVLKSEHATGAAGPFPHGSEAAPGAPSGSAPDFLLAGPHGALAASGARRWLERSGADTLGARVRAFFADLPDDDAPRLLAGALPFDRAAPDHLFQPDALIGTESAPAGGALDGLRWTARPEPDADAYAAAVARALARIGAPGSPLAKIVLARSLVLTADAPIDARALLARLGADHAAARFIVPLPSGAGGAPRRLVGATPELLVSRRGAEIVSQPLAGSQPRGLGGAEDEAAAAFLMGSEKDLREHALVVEAVLDSLSPFCRRLHAPSRPALLSTRTMWHLATRIEGSLRRPEETGAADLAAALHPTPAVCGSPRAAAMAAIRDLEPHDRGFYAGAVGWTAENGDGDWHVSLRCAELEGRAIRLHAGAGIVAGSDPAAETAETSAKFQTMLRALGVDEQGRPLADLAAAG